MKRMLPALALAATLSACATTSADFSGHWSYTNRCEPAFGHIANFDLRQQGTTVTGEWGEGDYRGRGQDGRLEGTVHGGRLLARLCVHWPEDSYRACPRFDPQQHLFTLEDGQLVWHRPAGDRGHARWVTLPRAGASTEEHAERIECSEPVDPLLDGTRG